MKIIKIKEDHYVVVDDSEIKEGDWFLPISGIGWELNKPRQADISGGYSNGHCKKITHSTEPLEYSSKIGKYWGKVMPLTLTIPEIKELLGEVDVEKKAREFATKPVNPINPIGTITCLLSQNGFEKGYNQALEDNKEKAIIFICKYLGVEKDSIIYNKIIKDWEQSLQPKTEWEVEFVDGKLKLK